MDGFVFNGNGGNRAHRAPLAEALRRENMHVLLLDYRGYGENAGAPSERGLALDARAARRYVLGRADVDARKIAYIGESIGSAVAVELATEHPPAALVLRSPLTSLADIGRYHYGWVPAWLLRDRFASVEGIARVRAPILVIAGDRDTIVPLEYSRRLYEAAREPKTLVVLPGLEHNDEELSSGPRLIAAISAFLATRQADNGAR